VFYSLSLFLFVLCIALDNLLIVHWIDAIYGWCIFVLLSFVSRYQWSWKKKDDVGDELHKHDVDDEFQEDNIDNNEFLRQKLNVLDDFLFRLALEIFTINKTMYFARLVLGIKQC